MANNNDRIKKELDIMVRMKTHHRCWYCGRKFTTIGAQELTSFTVDHVIPVKRGGSSADLRNLVPACLQCNRYKGHKRLDEWRNQLGVIRFYFEMNP